MDTAAVTSLVHFLMQLCSRSDTGQNSNAGARSNSHQADSVCSNICAASVVEKASTALVRH